MNNENQPKSLTERLDYLAKNDEIFKAEKKAVIETIAKLKKEKLELKPKKP